MSDNKETNKKLTLLIEEIRALRKETTESNDRQRAAQIKAQSDKAQNDALRREDAKERRARGGGGMALGAGTIGALIALAGIPVALTGAAVAATFAIYRMSERFAAAEEGVRDFVKSMTGAFASVQFPNIIRAMTAFVTLGLSEARGLRGNIARFVTETISRAMAAIGAAIRQTRVGQIVASIGRAVAAPFRFLFNAVRAINRFLPTRTLMRTITAGINTIFSVIRGVFGMLGPITRFAGSILRLFGQFSGVFTVVMIAADALRGAIDAARSGGDLIDIVRGAIIGAVTGITNIFRDIGRFFGWAADFLLTPIFGPDAGDGARTLITGFFDGIATAVDTVVALFANLVEDIVRFIPRIGEAIGNMLDGNSILSSIVRATSSFATRIVQTVGSFIGGVVSGLLNWIGDTLPDWAGGDALRRIAASLPEDIARLFDGRLLADVNAVDAQRDLARRSPDDIIEAQTRVDPRVSGVMTSAPAAGVATNTVNSNQQVSQVVDARSSVSTTSVSSNTSQYLGTASSQNPREPGRRRFVF